MDHMDKRVRSRFGYNVIALTRPSYEEFVERAQVMDCEDTQRRHRECSDPRVVPSAPTRDISFCTAEYIVLVSILKCLLECTCKKPYMTVQQAWREYVHDLRNRLEGSTWMRPLTFGQFLRVLLFLIICA
jgi:hypothetical protein